LSVRQRIEKVYYGKESITARFRLSLPPDGESPLKEVPSSPGSAVSPVFPRPPAENSKGSNLIERSDPFNEFETNKMWSKNSWSQTIDLNVPNISHGYWENFELTGEYNLRPTL
jgi:hypothetical protein